MTASDAARLLRWYPAAWRERYGDELVALMEDELGGRDTSIRFRLSIALAGLRERAHGAGIVGRGASAAERARAGALLVLCAWTTFVVAGASFAKLSEHFDAAVPRASRGLPGGAYRQVQIVSVVAAALLVVAGCCVLPAFMRFVRRGGWSLIARAVWQATVSSAALAVAIVPLAAWAHHLSYGQRNGTDAAYSAAVVAAAALLVAVLGLWTRAAVVAGRRLELGRGVLAAVSSLAIGVAASMVAMTVGTAIWWAVMAEHAPWFLHGTPAGSGGSPFNPQLAATMALMAASVALGQYGVARIGRSWLELRRATP